jgi:hypothetical protein
MKGGPAIGETDHYSSMPQGLPLSVVQRAAVLASALILLDASDDTDVLSGHHLHGPQEIPILEIYEGDTP